MEIKYETDSRKIKRGQTFVAIVGNTVDGHDYIEEAIKNGASSLIVSKENNYPIDYKVVDDTQKYLTEHLVNEYSSEFNNMKFIGITGTNGKTTTCYLIYQMLKELNQNVAYMGTIGFYYQDKTIPLNNTTPDILTFYKLLSIAKENNIDTIVMEVSSHALCFNRIAGITFDIGGFTNLTEDHLDYHKTMEEYGKAKLQLLNYLKPNAPMLVNSDDDFSNKWLEKYSCTTYGLKGIYQINHYDIKPDNTKINFSVNNQEYNVQTNLTSLFNVYNYLLAASCVNNLGFTIEEIINITNKIFPPKGRCETYKIGLGYAVVDYAHTPDAVEKVIEAYNKLKTANIYTIVGCGGDRDNKKRPIMGEIATRLSDYVIFTNDNPRTEDPKKIMQDIINGVNKNNYEIIYDRKEAIDKGISLLKKDDILLVLGKGHENYQIIGHEKIHLDDSEEILKHQKSDN